MGVYTGEYPVKAQNSADNVFALDVIGNKTDTTSGTSIVSLVKVVDTAVDDIKIQTASGDSTGTFSYLDAGAEQDVVEITGTTRKIIHGVSLDLTTMTQNGTIKLYLKIDGTNYREVDSFDFVVATDSDGYYISINMGITNDFKITYTEGADEAADRAIPYSVVYQSLE